MIFKFKESIFLSGQHSAFYGQHIDFHQC